MKLRPKAERDTSEKICNILLEAFGERRTTPQLLKSFYERKQKDGETLREFSHALCEIYNRIHSRDPSIIPSRDQALRDQFADNVRDQLLRKELKRMVRSNFSCKFLEVREEALHWAEEDEKPRPAKRNVSSEAVSTTKPNKEMDRVLQALEEQRKSIDNLSQALISFSRPNNTIRAREEEIAEAPPPPHVALMKMETEFVSSVKELDILQENVRILPGNTRIKNIPRLMAHRQPLPHHMSLTKLHHRQTVSLHSRESDSRRGRKRLSWHSRTNNWQVSCCCCKYWRRVCTMST